MFHVASDNGAKTVKCLVSLLALYLSFSHWRSSVNVGSVTTMLADGTLEGLKMIRYVHIDIQKNVFIKKTRVF